jgi:hypothetical protein
MLRMNLRPNRNPAQSCCAVAALAIVLFCGCGGAADPGTTNVNGLITLDGKPVDQASVGFIGKEGARLATAQTNSAGKFTIRAAMGKNVVTVAKASANPRPPVSDEPQLMPTQGEYQKMLQEAKTDLPAKYGDPKTSGLSVDVVEGMKEVEFALSSK